MSFSIQYKPLFKVNILSAFFLNDGTEDYFSLSDDGRKKQILKYNCNNVFNIFPSLNTLTILRNHAFVFKLTNEGFTVWAKVEPTNPVIPFIIPDGELSLDFIIALKDPFFFNYTNLDYSPGNKLLFFSNRRPAGVSTSFPLIELEGSHAFSDDNFALPNEVAADLLAALSVSATPVFSVVRIFMKGDIRLLDILNNSDEIIQPPKTYQLFFNNRNTFWRYIFNETQTVKDSDDVKKEDGDSKILVSKTAYPLTKTGFIPVKLNGKELPNPSAGRIVPDLSTNKIYSEIYM